MNDGMATSLEPEMDNYQKQLVDSCFEEGHYITAIKALEQLRSPNCRPAGYHIRQLLYIALHPVNKHSQALQTSGSPSKLEKRRLKMLMSISPDASLAAQRTLFAFAQTNTLEAIFSALPSLSRTADSILSIDETSSLAIEALCISRCKSCWNLLSPGLIQPVDQFHVKRYQDSDSETDDLEPVVAEHAWPVLKWLIFLFEQDEVRTEKKGLPRHSTLLLEQIPAPKGERSLRWEVDAPLDIVFSCLKVPESHQLLGARLFTLIINLANTTYFDFHAFIVGVYKRVTAQADILDDFLILLTRLPLTTAVLRFKIAFLQKCIAPSTTSSRASRPKPQVRAAPKPKHREETPGVSADSEITPPPHRIASKPVLPSFADISKALKNPPKKLRSTNNICFELLVSYGTLQSQIASSERDSEWVKLEDDDSWEKLLREMFRGDNVDDFRTTLTALRTTW